ncbi:hypothetical protein MPSEU_000585300 [Mayamaea pseudoterrestris]|nr:hypothetical protein MPSEU_000585300 [Mayamaea pseudoterrestris]
MSFAVELLHKAANSTMSAFLWSISEQTEQQSAIFIATAALAVAFPLIYYALNRNRKQYPPGPPQLPIIGNLHQMPSPNGGVLMEDLLLQWSKEYGLVYSLKITGMGTWVVVCDPDLVQRIYVSKNFQKSFIYKHITSVAGSESLLVVDKTLWSSKRKAFSPGFSPNFLKDMVNTMVDKLKRFENCIDNDISSKKPTNMLQRTQTFASDVIVAVAFGEDWGGDVNTEHPARVWNSEMARLMAGYLIDPFSKIFGYRNQRKIQKYEKLIDEEMMRILERRLADHSPGEKKDICSMAVEEMRRNSGGPLTYDDKVSITHQLKSFYFAGHDTTASSIAWAIWLLAQKPDILAKVREELKEHGIWADAAKPPTYEDSQKCVYLEAVIKETLRLYPPATGVSRMTDDCNEEWNGYRLSGAVLVLQIYVMGRHPLLWKEPESFRPERFLDGSEEPPNSKYSISAKFTAFSKGPRDCIGKYFALIEAKLAISALVTRYDFEAVDPKERLRVLITSLPANGASINFRHRGAQK